MILVAPLTGLTCMLNSIHDAANVAIIEPKWRNWQTR